MSDTFYSFEDWSSDYVPYGIAMPENQLVAEHPYFERAAMWSLHNNDPDKIVRLRGIEVSESASSGYLEPTYTIDRISAISSGATALQVVSLDSTNAAIPSQVSVVCEPGSVTPSSTLRRISRALATSEFGGDLTLLARLNSPFKAETNADTQDIVLNEGQGVAIDPSNDLQQGRALPVEFTVLFTIGTASYVVNAIAGSSSQPTIAIFNGVGSGVVVTVRAINSQILGTYTGLASEYSLERIHNHSGTGVVNASAIPLDSTATLPADVTAYRGARCVVDGAFRGSYISRSVIRRYSVHQLGTAQDGATNRLVKYTKLFYDGEIVLSYGEGIAIFARQPTNFFYPQLHATWTVERAPTGVSLVSRGFA